MCNSDFVKTIKCKDGDCLIFAVDIDSFAMDDITAIIGELQKQMPEVKMAIVPTDFIEQIIHLDKTLPMVMEPLTFVPGISATTDYTTPINRCYTDDELNSGWSGLE